MKVMSKEIEPNEAVLQVLNRTTFCFEDFIAIKDDADCYYAEKMMKGTHLEFKGTYRIKFQKFCKVDYIFGVKG